MFDYLAVSEFSNTDVVKVTNSQGAERDGPLAVEYNYELSNKVSSFDSELYISLDWHKTYENLIFDEARLTDYYFGRKIANTITKVLKLPEGYKVSHLPKGVYKTHNDISIQIGFEQKGQEIIYKSEIEIASGKIAKSDFELWNGYVNELKEIYNDQIVLTK